MNIDGVVFWDFDITSDDYLDSMIHGREIFDAFCQMHQASIHGYEDVEGFLHFATDKTIDAILADANVNVDASIDCDELRKNSSERQAKELIILTLVTRGHNKWVSKTYNPH